MYLFNIDSYKMSETVVEVKESNDFYHSVNGYFDGTLIDKVEKFNIKKIITFPFNKVVVYFSTISCYLDFQKDCSAYLSSKIHKIMNTASREVEVYNQASRFLTNEINKRKTRKELLFFALKHLESEIKKAKKNKDEETLNDLETKYSYYKQEMNYVNNISKASKTKIDKTVRRKENGTD